MGLELAADGGVTRPKILDRLLRFRKIALILAFTGAFFYSQFFFHPENMEVTRISEHSLMPGLVTAKFDKSGVAIKIYRQLTELSKSKTSQQQFIKTTFSEMGLESYTQNWKSKVAAVQMSGQNVYGFVRGHRNDGAEAQLLVVQLGKSEKARKMIARMLSFVDYAKEQVYWARDLVVVFVDGGENDQRKGAIDQAALGMDAFLLKYQKIESISSEKSVKRAVEAEEIQAQTGAILAGIVYDLGGMKIKGTHVVKIETNGINGQQVNLDLFNSVTKIAETKYSSRVAIFGTVNALRWQDNSPFEIPLKAVYTQAFTSIEGIHSVMGKYGVQSLTIGLSHDYTESQTGQFIEEISRMLNNVLERLHQSYFMYMLADDMHFTSIGFFTPVIIILISPLLTSAYFEWTKLRQFEMPFNYLLIHCIGFFIYVTTTLIFSDIGLEFVIQTTEFPFYGAIGCDGAITPPIPLIPAFLMASCAPIGWLMFWKWPVGSVGTVRILCLLESSLILGCLSLINFGLAVLSAAAVVPIVFMMSFPSTQRTRSFFRTVVLSILSPVGVITCLTIQAPEFFGVADPYPEFEDFSLASKLVHKMISYHVVYGAHHFFLLCVTAYPIWNLLFATAMHWSEEEEEDGGTVDNTGSFGTGGTKKKAKKNKRN